MHPGRSLVGELHLGVDGTVFVEALRPDPTRFDAGGHRVETRPGRAGTCHVVRSRHDQERRTIHIAHDLGDADGTAKSTDPVRGYRA